MSEENIYENEKDGLIKLSGTIEHIIYANEENGYTVCDLGTDDDDIVTLTGIMPYIAEGDSVIVWGEWKHNAKYGRQFVVDGYERNMPANAVAILRYLSSGAIKGIGPKTAQKIVDAFGDDTLEVLENHPDWLSDIPGMSLKKAKKICEDFKAKAGIRSAMIFFREFFGAATTIKIYKRFGAAAVDIAKADPYRLCEEIDGIGFERTDKMAVKLGVGRESEARLLSGISYVLSREAAAQGHVCLPLDKLAADSSRLLETDIEKVYGVIDEMIAAGRLKVSRFDSHTYVYEKYAYDSEVFISRKLLLLDKLCPNIVGEDVAFLIEKEERRNGFSYAAMQKRAIALALESGVLILTGGPGTGKTTVVRALLGIFQSMDMKVALAAPTGRAAKRLSEATSCEARTVHRLLEYDYATENGGRPGFRRNETDLLDESVIIVDEASMIDNSLMSSLLRAIKPGARIILIGDADQLPSVGAGNVLRDLIDSKKFATVSLGEIFRQAERSLIITNAHRINHGEMPELSVKDNDFFYLPRSADAEISETITELCKTRLPRTYGDIAVNGTQVISPSRKGEAGTENLNVKLQAALNPPSPSKREYKYRDVIFREGDRVMQTKNNYELEWFRGEDNTGSGIFNGDIGRIERIDVAGGQMEILFDDKRVIYDTSVLDELEHAYAVTVHKSQGSEYPIVVMPMYNAPPMLLTRNLFYTSVTRAQRMVILVGRKEVISKMVSTHRISERYTCLKQRLCEDG